MVDGMGRLTSEIFVQRAKDILRVIADMRAEVGLQGAIEMVDERFVENEPDPQLRRLGEVLALARRQALIQGQLDDDRAALHSGRLDHEERESTGHHYEMLRHQACTYNHLLRGMIEASGHYFTRNELLDWLTTASQGRFEWAQGEVRGAVSEIALHAALQGMREFRGVRYASVEEDLIGYDFVAEWQGQLLTLDAKTGLYEPMLERKRGHRHLEISVPREAVKDLQVNQRGLALLRREIRQVLNRNFYTSPHGHREFLHTAVA